MFGSSGERIKIIFEHAEDGSVTASCPDLPDCQVKGKNQLEALQKVKQLIVKRMNETKNKVEILPHPLTPSP